MSSATTMYALKPIVSLSGDSVHTKSMYRMKNIHGIRDHASHESKIVSDITEQVIKFLKSPLPEVAALEDRQEKILAQLADLREQMSKLCGVLKQSGGSKSSTAVRSNEGTVNAYLVVNANPARPPFSLLALQRLWADTNIRVSAHVHSSVTESPPEFPATRQDNGSNNSINLSLIWKKVSDVELVISGVHGCPLLGEVNLLRYLSRLIASHNYESSVSAIESGKIDSVLDLCYKLSRQESPKDRQATFSSLGGKLGKEQWLLGKKQASIADVAAWSAIKQVSSGKLPSNLADWFGRCEKMFSSK